MKSSKLWELLRSMDIRERGRLQKFVLSPFFNHRQDVIKLLEILEESARHSSSPPEKASVFGRLFPGEPFDDFRLRLTASLLLKLAEKFLVCEFRETKAVDYEIQLAALHQAEGHHRVPPGQLPQYHRDHQKTAQFEALRSPATGGPAAPDRTNYGPGGARMAVGSVGVVFFEFRSPI